MSHGFEVPSVKLVCSEEYQGSVASPGNCSCCRSWVLCTLQSLWLFKDLTQFSHLRETYLHETSGDFGVFWSELDTESQVLLSSPGNVTPSHCPESDDATSEACKSGKREAALLSSELNMSTKWPSLHSIELYVITLPCSSRHCTVLRQELWLH